MDIPHVSNVMSVYNGASADALRSGLSWYQDAHDFCVMRAGNRGQFGHAAKVERIAGITAALSPMNEWENNKRKAIEFLNRNGDIVIAADNSNGIGLSKNVAKAIRIYNGEHPLDVLGGNKVRAFYATILDPTADNIPVIDRHAFDIAVGERTNDKRRAILSRKGVYNQFADVFREAALIVGIGSAQMQAITWVAWKEMHGIVSD